MMTPADKYLYDPSYHSLVDYLTAFIVNAQFTPSELREAAIFACIRVEQLGLRQHVLVYPFPESVLGALREMESFLRGGEKNP